MSNFSSMTDALESLVDPFDNVGDWEEIVRRAQVDDTPERVGTRSHRRKVGLAIALAAAVIVGTAVAAVSFLGQPAPKSVQKYLHNSAVLGFAGSPALVKATARVVAESPDATLYGISDREGNYCVELVGARKGLVWSFMCGVGVRVGDRYATPGATGADQVASIVVDGVVPPVVQWGRLTTGTTKVQAVYPDGTTEQIPLGSNGFFVYQPSPQHQLLARRVPMTIQFLRADGSTLSTEVLPPQPLTVQGLKSGTISGRILISGAAKVQLEHWGGGIQPRTRYVPIRPDGTFTISWHRDQPTTMHIVDRHNKLLTDYLEALPESYWRSLVKQAHATRTTSQASSPAGKTKSLNWTDVQTLNTGGHVVYHTTKITIAGDQYTVAVSATNRSDHAVDLMTYPAKKPVGYLSPESFGMAYREQANPNITTRRLVNTRATTFTPALPKSLQPGETWKGTFSGRSRELRNHHTWWIIYGMVFPGGYWVSDKTFST